MVRRLSRKMEQMENSKECTLDEWVRMAREYSTEMKGIRGCLRVHQIFFVISSTITLIGVACIILLLRMLSRADKELMESLPAFLINIPISPCIIFLILFPYIVQLLLNVFDFSLIRLLRMDSGKLPTNVHTTLHKFRYVEKCLRQSSFPVLDWEDCNIFLKFLKVAFQPCQRILFKENERNELNDRCHCLLTQNDKNYWRNHLSSQERQRREMEEREEIKEEIKKERQRKEEEQQRKEEERQRKEEEERKFLIRAYQQRMEFNAESYIAKNQLSSYIYGHVSWEDQKKVENDPALTPEQKKEVLDALHLKAIIYY